MAAGLLAYRGAGRVEVRSTGSAPGNHVNPSAVAVMAGLGIDRSGEQPQRLTDYVVKESDVAVTMGCGDGCPIYPGKRYLGWEAPDPADLPPEDVRPIRDEIDRHVLILLSELLAES